MKCPFVHASGQHCTGDIWSARAYGNGRENVVEQANIRKIALFCTKGDHAGAVPISISELRRRGLLAEAITACDNVLPPGYTTVAGFAKKMGVSVSTVKRWIAQGMPVVSGPKPN